MEQDKSPKISVVIPAKNAGKTIRKCLESIYRNNYPDFEVIVVDDGCTDNTMDIVSEFNCTRVKNNMHVGVSGARNAGASAAQGDVLVFIDSDIVVPEDAFLKMQNKIGHPDVHAVVGALREDIMFDDFPSIYKNLWMCYTFNNLPERISLIFSSIAAIKKDVFLKLRGFDVNYKYPNVEDNELGLRLRSSGCNIVLDKTLLAEHLKQYNYRTLLKTHYLRTKGLVKLYNRNKIVSLARNNPTSVPNSFLLNIPLTVAFIILFLSFLFSGYVYLKVAAVFFLLLMMLVINRYWFYFLGRRKGLSFVLKSVFYLPLELSVIVFGLTFGQLEYFLGRRY